MCKSLHSPYLSGLYVHACNCARVCECACVCARACVHVHICINLQLFSVCSPIMSVELSTMKTKGMCGPEVRQTHIRTQKEDRHGERMRAAHLKTFSLSSCSLPPTCVVMLRPARTDKSLRRSGRPGQHEQHLSGPYHKGDGLLFSA